MLRIDGDPVEIERYLTALGVRHSAARVRDACRRFGTSYAAADRILAFDGGADFDRAYERFIRCCRVERTARSIPAARSGRPAQ